MKVALLRTTFFAFVLATGLSQTFTSTVYGSDGDRPHAHSFLYDKFPELRQEAAALPFLDDDEEALAETKNDISPDLSFEQFMFNECFLQEGLLTTRANSTKQGDEHLAVLAATQMTRQRDTSPPSAFGALLFSGKINNPEFTVLEDIILSSLDMHHAIQQFKPDPNTSAIVFLGRSSCLHQVAMEELSKKTLKGINLPLIHVNYSGHADALSKRAAKLHHGNRGIALNMVTEDKLQFYMAYLSLKGLPRYKQLFIVDIIGTGGGMRSWLGLLETLMTDMNLTMPKVHLFVLTPFVRTLIACKENSIGFYKDLTRLFAYSHRNRKITFDEVAELNVKSMEVDATPIHIGCMTQSVIDLHVLQRHCTHGSFFPAQMWNDEGYAIAQKGGDCHEKIYGRLRYLIEHILDIFIPELQRMELAFARFRVK